LSRDNFDYDANITLRIWKPINFS